MGLKTYRGGKYKELERDRRIGENGQMEEVSPNRDNWVMGVKLSSETAPKSLKETGPPVRSANVAFGRKSGFS